MEDIVYGGISLNTLVDMRGQIAKLDEQILELLDKRIELASIICNWKRGQGSTAYSPEVEKEKVEILSSLSKYPGLVEVIWPVIMCYSRSID